MVNKGNKLNKARQQLIDVFLECLNEEQIPWKRGWNVVGCGGEPMHNPISGTRYRGVNAFLLMFVAFNEGYTDPRWCTFKQASNKGWKIKKGSKGVPVEYWNVYDVKEKKYISLSEYQRLRREEDRPEEDFRLVSKTYTVFNGYCIEGIPELEKKETVKLNDIEMNAFVEAIKDNMGVGYREFGDRAYYAPHKDEVTMPPRGQFKDQYEFSSTLLHELSHATGHKSRLDREICNSFGSENYAIEELRAEMSSAFLGQYMDISMDSVHLDNHKAYIQSWAKELKEDPNILFRAIKDAENIADYLIELGGLENLKEMEFDNEEGLEFDSLDEQINSVHLSMSGGKAKSHSRSFER